MYYEMSYPTFWKHGDSSSHYLSKKHETMSSAGRGDARPSNKAGGGGRGGGGGGSHSSKKESILELAKVTSAPFVVYPSIGVVCSARPP